VNAMPEMVTHRYDPEQGPCLNLRVLSDPDAERLLDHLRNSRPALRPDYLARRRAVEAWLAKEASEALGQPWNKRQHTFFSAIFHPAQTIQASRACAAACESAAARHHIHIR